MDIPAAARVSWFGICILSALSGCEAAGVSAVGQTAALTLATPSTIQLNAGQLTAPVNIWPVDSDTVRSALALEQRAEAQQATLAATARESTALRRARVVAAADAALGSSASTPNDDLARLMAAAQARAKDLATLDTQLDSAFTTGYSQLAKNREAQAGALQRLALLQFRTFYRRSGPGANDHRVGPLPRAPQCADGAIDGALLWQFLDPASRARDTTQRTRVSAVRALAALQARLGCASRSGLRLQDQRLGSAFDQLASALARQGLSELMPSVVDVLAAPFLLSFDATKFYGPKIASYAFWRAQHGLARAGLENHSSVLNWLGVWLYDRQHGRLVGLPATCGASPSAQPCVKAGVLIESIARPANLGNADCTLLEMISRGDGPNGYQCTGSLCGTPDPSLAPELARAGLSRKLQPACPSGRVSKFGAPCAQIQKLCVNPNTDLSGHSRSPLCGELKVNPNSGRFLCGVELRKQSDPATAAIRCVAEASTACGSQLERLTKGLQLQTFAGSGCTAPRGTVRSDGDGFTGPNYADRAADARERFDNASSRERIREAIEREFGPVDAAVFSAAYDNAVSLLSDGTSVEFIEPDATAAPGSPERDLADGDAAGLYDANTNTIYVDAQTWNDREAAGRGEQNRDTLMHEVIHAMLDFMGLADATTEEREHNVIRALSTSRDCAADDPGCSQGCSAQDEQLAALAECAKSAPVPRDLGYVDPLPEDASAPAWTTCFAESSDEIADGQRACQTVDCPIDTVCDAARGGVCVSNSVVAVPGGFHRACGAVDCADGPAQFDNGRCRCGSLRLPLEPQPELLL
jgi:hypothetical protein